MAVPFLNITHWSLTSYSDHTTTDTSQEMAEHLAIGDRTVNILSVPALTSEEKKDNNVLIFLSNTDEPNIHNCKMKL